MKMKNLVYVFCMILPGIYGSFNVSEICNLVANGVKFQDPSNCSQWYDCLDGVPSQPNACTNGTFFDKHNQTCVASNLATCNENLCANQPTGIFIADPSSCSTYFYCSQGSSTKGTCKPSYNFNPVKQACMANAAYECTNNTLNYEQLCLLISDNIFIADTEDCQGWYTCKENLPNKGKCPPGYLFDSTTASCNFTDNVPCGSRSTTNITTVQVPKSMGNCSNPGVYVSDNSTCTGYYYCYADGDNGNLLLSGKCNSGFFDASNGGSCVSRSQVNCPYNRCVGGVSWVSVANTDCKAYLKCSNNFLGYCPENYPYFDETTQQCVANKIAYPSCV